VNINQKLLEKLKLMPEALVPITAPVKNGHSSSSPTPTPIPETAPTTPPKVSSPTQELDLLSLDLASLKPLLPATIPDEGEFFDVNVTLAASPSNFTVIVYSLKTIRVTVTGKFHGNIYGKCLIQIDTHLARFQFSLITVGFELLNEECVFSIY
jgi:hypothetical protein